MRTPGITLPRPTKVAFTITALQEQQADPARHCGGLAALLHMIQRGLDDAELDIPVRWQLGTVNFANADGSPRVYHACWGRRTDSTTMRIEHHVHECYADDYWLVVVCRQGDVVHAGQYAVQRRGLAGPAPRRLRAAVTAAVAEARKLGRPLRAERLIKLDGGYDNDRDRATDG